MTHSTPGRFSTALVASALWRSLAALVMGLGLASAAWAQPAQLPGRDFDHLRTGFALSGAHTDARCESCHLNGVFKGTPRDCETCHVGGGRLAKANVVKNANHIATSQTCETCHNTRAFAGARMNHAGVPRGTCSTCHNGVQAAGKTGSHVPTTANCDSCHGPAAWRPVIGFDHGSVTTGTCATCHNGQLATGKSATHTPYSNVAATANLGCDSCHKSGFRAWTPASVHSNANIGAQCGSCHSAAKPGNAVHAGQTVCETCHKSATTWTGAKVDHTSHTSATTCTGCHNGNGATGKGATHIPVAGANCVACHSTSVWKPARFDHTQVAVTAQCASCHTGGFPPADGKTATHTPYQLVAAAASANCDTCHKAGYAAWTPAKLHQGVSLIAQCATCHNSVKPSTNVHTGQTVCEDCHKTTASWAATVDHNRYTAATDCTSCHNGNGATGKNATHVPVANTNCVACHSVSTWKPTRFDHTQVPVTAQCASCHSGGFQPADGKPANHTPYQLVAASAGANCDACHKAGYVAWTPAKLHQGVTVTAQCATCHTSAKPSNATHAGQTVCESCHKSTNTWTGAKVDHSSFTVATDCVSCHSGNGATGKNATHIPVGANNCVSCHSTSVWKPSRFNHTQVPVTAQCASCHTGAYQPADGKPANHTPYQLVAAAASANCDACHKAGYVAWTPAKLHQGVTVTTQCATCHASAKPNTAVHAGQTVCETCHKTTVNWSAKVDHATFTAATDCTNCHNGNGATGKNATHVPVANTNCVACHSISTWKPSRFNHTQIPVTAQCASCHTGSFPPADGKPATHTPYQLVAATASANCDACHKAGYVVWTPAKLHQGVTVTTQCATCHASAKPNNTAHAGQTVCETCHKSTTTWSGAKIDHATFTAATDCTGCHNGSSATGKNATHVPVANTNCISCHSTSVWKPSRFNHTQIPVTAQCATCHTGSFPPADGKPANHTPYQLVAAAASANCDACHKSGYTAWTPAKLHQGVTVTIQCATCHASAKPNNTTHVGQTVCENCHKSTSTWSGAKVDHSTYTAATDCTSCHNGNGASGKNATHVPVANTNCIACHSTSVWKPSRFNHTQVPVTAQCATCHTGSFPPADGKPANHTPYQLVAAAASANCDACHKSGYTAWTPAKLHQGVMVTTQCATCHASAKPNNTTHVGQTVCENCHKSTSTWSGAKVDHSTYTAATDCTSCHNGNGATGKNATHVPVGTTNCIACHSTSVWKPSRFNHTQVPVTAQCASCHTGSFPPADGKPANHTPYQLVAAAASANCDACHKSGYTAWTPAKLHQGVTVTTQCATCHASAKPNNTTHAGQTVCETCHKTTSTWSGAKVDHSTFTAATVCANCHNGSGASGKNATHVPVGTTNCIACHSTSVWKPSRFNHTQVPVTAQCASCHTGSFPPADGKPANHTPYQLVAAAASANCDACHKSGYTAWTPARLHQGVTVTTQCATCHTSIKPNNTTHAGQTVCETCHKTTTTWSGAKVDHSTFTAATVCSTCHNGSGATGKNATHVPVGTTNCISCHTTSVWKPSRFNHTQVPVTAQCATCHTGTFAPADGKPANHIPYQLVTGASTANCDTCHRAGYTSWAGGKLHTAVTVAGQCKTCHNGTYTSQGAVGKNTNHVPETQLLNGATMECNACHTTTTSWSQRMNHNNSLGGGAGWCKGCHDRSTPYSAGMEKKALTHEKKTPAAIDCSESGCHRPLGNKGATFSKWD